ncbi:MAG: protein kinase [Gemmatimonadota bacterium]
MVGEQIGRYRIESELGRGGMGVVYRATQVTLNRTVAVKMLPRQMADEENLERFRREAQTLAQLAHEGIVHIYDVEEHEGSHFIIMEFVGGGSLGGVIQREAPLPPHRAVEITAQVASALSAAHRRGIIHRDIKPDNILFDDQGRPRLTDFGIAHMRDANSKTKTGVMLGTPYYMSPEQARGKPVTPASDLYALGVLLYEMLSGEVPFQGEDAVAIAIQHIQQEPPSLAERAPGTPAELVAVVSRLMAKDPEQRYATADALIDALQEGGWVGNTTLGRSSPRVSAERPAVSAPDAGAALAGAAAAVADGVRRVGSSTALQGAAASLNRTAWLGLPRSFWIGALLLAVVAAVAFWPSSRPPERQALGPQSPVPAGPSPTPGSGDNNSGPSGPLPQEVIDVLVPGREGDRNDTTSTPSNNGDRPTRGNQGDRNPAPIDDKPTPPPDTARKPPPVVPEVRGFDAAAARRAILAVVERQRRATEAGDLRGLLADVHPNLIPEATRDIQAMLATVGDLSSQVADVQVEFEDDHHAYVEFHTHLTGRLLATGEFVEIADDWINWSMVYESGRWLIWEW